MSRILLTAGDCGTYEVTQINPDDSEGKDILIQTDWDYPGIASSFGWEPCCGSGSTDGTVNCPDCGKTASEMIQSAGEYLDNHCGDIVPDPGYFDG